MRKVFLEDLPIWKSGANKGRVNWLKSIGYEVKFIYDDIESKVKIVDCIPKKQSLHIKYEDSDVFEINTGGFQKCALGNLLEKYTDKFKVEIGFTFKDAKRDITIIDRKYRKDANDRMLKYYKYKCNKCGFECGEHYINAEFREEYWILEADLLRGSGCACCSNSSKIVIPHINSIVANPETHWIIKYFQCGYDEAKMYTYRSNQKIKPICPECGRIKDKEITISNLYKYKSTRCSCGDGISYGHKFVFNLLTQLQLKFVDNHTFDWCKFYNPFKEKEVTGEYDFVLENNKLIIEVDGNFHRTDNKMNGQTKEESKFLDDEKDILATKNGYRVIRISDENNIKDNIVNSELIYLFDLSNISWKTCEEFALKNRVKEACCLKNGNPNLTTTKIGEIMNVSKMTIITYLKKGTKLGWCYYNPKEEMKRNASKNGKSTGQPVEIFKDNISIGIFKSLTELSKLSKELFGIILDRHYVSKVCDTEEIYKGFSFKHITNKTNNK